MFLTTSHTSQHDADSSRIFMDLSIVLWTATFVCPSEELTVPSTTASFPNFYTHVPPTRDHLDARNREAQEVATCPADQTYTAAE